MSTDPTGNYSLVPSYFVQNGDTVLPSQHNPVLEDIAAGLTARVMRDGRSVMTGNLQMGGNKVSGLDDGTNPGDAVNKSQLDAVEQSLDDGKLDKDASNATARTKWRLRAIGEIIYVDTSLTGVEIPPVDAGFIELTAGLDGSGQYNEGKLTGEVISGSGATLTATAVIDDADSPMDGETIHLLNSEERVRYAGERAKSGDVFDDQTQQYSGALGNASNGLWVDGPSTFPTTGPFQGVASSGSKAGVASSQSVRITFNNSLSVRTGDRELVKGQFMVAFLKYKDVA